MVADDDVLITAERSGRASIAVTSGVYLVATGAATAAQFLTVIVANRRLPVDDAGRFSTLVAVGAIISGIACFGFPAPASRRVVLAEHDNALLRRALSSSLLPNVAMAGGFAVLLSVFGSALWRLVLPGEPFGWPERVVLGGSCVGGVMATGLAVLQSLRRVRTYATAMLLRAIGFASVLTAVLAGLVARDEGLVVLSLGLIIAPALALAGILRALRPWLAPAAVDRRLVRTELLIGLPMIAHHLFGWALDSFDRVFLARRVGVAPVATYAGTYVLATALMFLLNALNGAWSPVAFRWQRDGGAWQGPLRRSGIQLVLAATAAGMAILSLSRQLLPMMLPASAEVDVFLLAVVLGSLVFQAAYMALSNPLFFFGATLNVALATGLSALVNAGALFAFVRPGPHQLVAVAASTTLGYLTLSIVSARFANRVAGLEFRTSGPVLGAAAGCSIALMGAGALVDRYAWAALLAGLLGAGCASWLVVSQSRSDLRTRSIREA